MVNGFWASAVWIKWISTFLCLVTTRLIVSIDKYVTMDLSHPKSIRSSLIHFLPAKRRWRIDYTFRFHENFKFKLMELAHFLLFVVASFESLKVESHVERVETWKIWKNWNNKQKRNRIPHIFRIIIPTTTTAQHRHPINHFAFSVSSSRTPNASRWKMSPKKIRFDDEIEKKKTRRRRTTLNWIVCSLWCEFYERTRMEPNTERNKCGSTDDHITQMTHVLLIHCFVFFEQKKSVNLIHSARVSISIWIRFWGLRNETSIQ